MAEQSGEVSSSSRTRESIEVSDEALEIRNLIRPFVKKTVNGILLWSNNRYGQQGSRMAGTIACAVMEYLIVSAARKVVKDYDDGPKFIESVYDAAKQDALREWSIL